MDDDWEPQYFSLPSFSVTASVIPHGPLGFIDYRRREMLAANQENETKRRCQIRTVRTKPRKD